MINDISDSQSTTKQKNKDARLIDDLFKTEHLKSNLKEKTVKGGFVAISNQIVKFVINTASTALLARLLTPGDFGLVAMVNVFTGFVGIFSNLGLSAATIQYKEITNKQVSTLFWLNVVLGMLVCIICIVLSPFISWFYKEPKLLLITIAIGCTFIFGGFTAQHYALLRRQLRFTSIACIDLASTIIGIISAIFFALFVKAGYWSLIAMYAFQSFSSMLLHWFFLPWVPSLPKFNIGLRPMLNFGKNITGFNIMNYIARNADNFIIGRWIGPSGLGIYSKAYNLMLLPIDQITFPIGGVAIPSLSRLADEPERYRRVFLQFQSKLSLLTIPVMTFLLISADSVILLVLGQQWKDAIPVFRWLGIAGIVQGALNSNNWLFTSQGRTKELFHWGIIGSVIVVTSFFIGIPWGINGVAASYGLIDLLICSPILVWMVGRRGHVSSFEYLRSLKDGFMLSLIIAVFCITIKNLWYTGIPIYNFLIMAGSAIAAVLFAICISKKLRYALFDTLKLFTNNIIRKKTK